MSLLPYILSELHGMSAALDGRRHGPRWERDDYGLLDDLLTYRDAVHPALAPARGLLRLVDLDAPEQAPARHHLVIRPRHLLRRQLSAPTRRAQELLERRQQQKRKEATKKDDGLLINVDVQQFLPEELSVQVLKDQGCVVVEGKHEERPDEHGYVQRQFTRRYKLPAHVDPDTVTSKLTSDGVLQVTAPRRETLPAPKENVRHITITQTDRPAVKDAAEEVQTVPPKDQLDKQVTGKDKNKSQIENEAMIIGA
uniref:Heat shock protein 28.7 n=1 Tax=Frankliniella occidentalis TaxID=133901 RepID=M1G0P5_FRAOC|nr:heat shock protein 28.7 [Frankliniella occidentalis]